MEESWALVEEMTADGIPPDEFAYTALINGYKRARPVSICCWLSYNALPDAMHWFARQSLCLCRSQPCIMHHQVGVTL